MKSERRQDLRQRIQDLPGLSPEDRAALLGLLAEKKRYGLVWEDKPEAAHELLREKIPLFVEDAKRRIEASEEDAPHHVLIEGDNLHALTALQYTHAGKIDVIYIDPPYNTGNKDFRYNDDYVDKEDSFRHSKWLSFMGRRLKQARGLLKDSGVLWISVDDNEVAQLKSLCDELFGEGNFLGMPVRRRRNSQANLSKNLSTIHEYVCVFAASSFSQLNKLRFSSVPDGYSNPDRDKRGPYTTMPCSNVGGARYPIVTPAGTVVNDEWRFKEETFRALREDGRIVFPRAGKGKPRYKLFLAEKMESGVIPNSWWDDVESNQEGSSQLEEIGLGGVFNNPKPLGLINRILNLSGKRDSLVLDFFAGSGATLHATMALNAEDGGKRQCILVTNNENGICEEVCYERNKRVIQGYRTPKGEDIPGLTANHLHYLKTAFVDREPTTNNRRQLVKLAVDLLRLKENAWDRIAGLSTGKEVQAFQGKDFTLFVVVDVDRIPEVVEQVRSLPGKSKVYVLSPDADPFSVDFEEVQDRVDLVALPEAIYRSLLPVWRTLPGHASDTEVVDA